MRIWWTYLAAVSIASALIGSGSIAARAAEIKMGYAFVANGYSPSKRFSKPSGVFYDAKRGELYVADTGNGQIVILDKKGHPVARIPHSVVDPVSGDRRSGEPRSVVVLKNGDILVADNQCSYLDVLDFRGSSVRKVWLGELVGKSKKEVTPRCLALDQAGNVYVGVAGGETEIMVLTPDLKLKAKMGVGSSGESRNVTGLWVDKDGRIYATYAFGVCVRAYAPDGKQLMSFGVHDAGPNNFSLPSGLVVDGQGRLWVVDTLRHVVTVFKLEPDAQGLKWSFVSLALGGGEKNGQGQGAGEMSYPVGIACDGSNRIYVVESAGARVQAFDIRPPQSPS